VRVRCSICRGVFEVAADGAQPAEPAAAAPSAASAEPAQAAAPVEAPQPTPQLAAAPDPTPAPEPAPSAAPAAGPAFQPVSAPAPAPQPTPAPSAASAPAPASPPAAAPRPTPAPVQPSTPAAAPAASGRSPFGAADPNAKARRLARALVSDIVTYHPERRDRALADGTLKREFMDEIKKSWEEYVGQVGAETARGTTHFRDALNDILAKGQSIF
jgi:outer membrane biosynthesis protein TonB